MKYRYHHDEALETIARKIISQYDPNLLDKPAPIPVEEIMEQVYSLILDFQYIRNNGRILGETVFVDAMIPIYERENNEGYKLIPVKAGTVLLDMSLLDNRSDGRYRFTCAHELAHWVIDKEYFMQLGETAAMTDGDSIADTTTKKFETGTSRNSRAGLVRGLEAGTAKNSDAAIVRSSEVSAILERQANKMASRILMPKCTLKKAFYQAHGNVINVVDYLANFYVVSRQAMEIRLKEMGLLTT